LVLLKMKADIRNLQLIDEIHPDVPKTIKTEPTRLKQIILNLVGNSLKFTFKGHIKVKIEVLKATTTQENGLLILKVEDTGLGIKEAHQGRLFSAFTMVGETESINKLGCGLGLNISNKLAKRLG